MTITGTAYYEEADSTESLDLYELLLEDGLSIDFWWPKGTKPTTLDIHAWFDGKDEESG